MMRRMTNNAPEQYLAWLNNASSLTQRLKGLAGDALTHLLLSSGYTPATDADTRWLPIQKNDPVWTREIEWRSNDELWVKARVVIPQSSLEGQGAILADIENESLGITLFQDPTLSRSPFELHADERGRWTRHSTVTFHGKPLLISETFFPALLNQPATTE